MADNRTIPTAKNPDLVTFSIEVDGGEIPDTYEVLQVSISQEINRIPAAQIILKDGSASEETFAASSSEEFEHGKKIDILLGYHNEEERVFSGIITKQRIQVRKKGSRLFIECRDAAYRTTLQRNSRYFEESSDSEAIEEILGEYSGLTAEVEDSSITHQELVQYDASDWDFILSRADVNGLFCLVDDGTIKIGPPDLAADPVLQLQYGAALLDLDLEMDGRHQHEAVEASGWDQPNLATQTIEGASADYDGPGNLSPTGLADKLQTGKELLRHSGYVKQEELQAWADAKQQHNQLSKVRGSARIQGTAEIKPGDFVDLAGLGERFSGKTFVSALKHKMQEGQWWTTVQLGMREDLFPNRFAIHSPKAGNLIPAVNGLQIGIVTTLEGDPEGEDRIKVRLPLVNDAAEGIWTRLSCTEAGGDRGHYYRPEIGDEVVVGFINDDPRDAIMLGALHSSSQASPETPSDDNHKKGYLSRSGMRFEFDDEKSIVTLSTPGGALLVMDDDQGSVLIEDQNGNKIEMSSDGVTIDSANEINIKASADINVEGANINIKAQAGLVAEGSATAELSAGGSTTIKGGVVQIN